MRTELRLVPRAGVAPAGDLGKRQSRQRDSIRLGACSCGGPGGHPGMQPICIACAHADRYMRQVYSRNADRARGAWR